MTENLGLGRRYFKILRILPTWFAAEESVAVGGSNWIVDDMLNVCADMQEYVIIPKP